MSTRRPLVAGNWKLHNTISESVALGRALKGRFASAPAAEVVVAPVFTALAAVKDALSGSHIGLAAQNVYWEARGAFTGEVSAPLLKDVGCTYCIIGHSERRQLFGETDDTVRRRTVAALEAGLTPIVCVGETLPQREAGNALSVVRAQLDGSLSGLDNGALRSLVIAYEPVWAIGTGRTATPSDAQEVHAAIRLWLTQRADKGTSDVVRVLYGGSVKPDNARDLLSQPDIDGALVGGASLKVETFAPIVEAAG